MPVPFEGLTDVEVGAPPRRILDPPGGTARCRARPSSAAATASSWTINALSVILSLRFAIATITLSKGGPGHERCEPPLGVAHWRPGSQGPGVGAPEQHTNLRHPSAGGCGPPPSTDWTPRLATATPRAAGRRSPGGQAMALPTPGWPRGFWSSPRSGRRSDEARLRTGSPRVARTSRRLCTWARARSTVPGKQRCTAMAAGRAGNRVTALVRVHPGIS